MGAQVDRAGACTCPTSDLAVHQQSTLPGGLSRDLEGAGICVHPDAGTHGHAGRVTALAMQCAWPGQQVHTLLRSCPCGGLLTCSNLTEEDLCPSPCCRVSWKCNQGLSLLLLQGFLAM